MIQMLCSQGDEWVPARTCINKRIKRIVPLEAAVLVEFDEGTVLKLRDDGQSCCESRYVTTDDDLAAYSGAKLIDIELADAPSVEDEYGEEHEVQFLRIHTDKGVAVFETHNEHNGYYGGFWIRSSLTKRPRD